MICDGLVFNVREVVIYIVSFYEYGLLGKYFIVLGVLCYFFCNEGECVLWNLFFC